MDKVVVTITISYDLDKAAYPGEILPSDIEREIGMWRTSVKSLLADEFDESANTVVEDVTVTLDNTV